MRLNSEQCLHCIHKCKLAHIGAVKCPNFDNEVTDIELKELNYEIRKQNVNLKRFAKANGLKYTYLIKMLRGKCEMNYKTLYLLNRRLNEVVEWLPYVDSF